MENLICQINNDFKFFAMAFQDTVKFCSTNGSILKNLIPKEQIQTNYTSICWGVHWLRNKKLSKVLAVGTQDGFIYIWDINSLEVKILGDKGDGHKSPINSLAFNKDSSILYSASSSEMIEWNIQTDQIIRNHKMDNPVNVMALSKDNTKMILGGKNIRMLDLSSGKTLKEFVGHSKEIKDLLFSPDNSHFCSCSGRYIHIWSTDSNNESTNASVILISNSELAPSSLQINSFHSSKNNTDSYHLSCNSENGQEIFIWEYSLPPPSSDLSNLPLSPKMIKKIKRKRNSLPNSDQGNLKPIQPSTKILLKNSKEERLLGSIFINQYKILVAQGNFSSNPKFSDLAYLNKEGEFLEEITLEGQKSEKKKKETKENTERKIVVVAGEEISNIPSENFIPVDGRIVSQAEDSSTIEKQLEFLEKKSSNKKNNKKMPKVDSLESILIQAIKTQDLQLLNATLKIDDLVMIEKTVEKMPSVWVVKLFGELVKRFEGNPSNASLLSKWIKFVLLYHSSFLMSIPNFSFHLKNLYRIINKRMESFDPLLKLEGRLELLLRKNASSSTQKKQILLFDTNERESFHSNLLNRIPRNPKPKTQEKQSTGGKKNPSQKNNKDQDDMDDSEEKSTTF